MVGQLGLWGQEPTGRKEKDTSGTHPGRNSWGWGQRPRGKIRAPATFPRHPDRSISPSSFHLSVLPNTQIPRGCSPAEYFYVSLVPRGANPGFLARRWAGLGLQTLQGPPLPQGPASGPAHIPAHAVWTGPPRPTPPHHWTARSASGAGWLAWPSVGAQALISRP